MLPPYPQTLDRFNGMRIIQNIWMTEPGDPITVYRTWVERLFTRPWRPWVASRIVIPTVPRKDVLKIGDDILMMHPDTFRALKAQLKEGHLWQE